MMLNPAYKKWLWAGLTAFVAVALFTLWFLFLRGDGGFKRMTTLTGVYAVCKPSGYEVVCFLDASSPDGGLSCLPLSQTGGKCF